MSSFARGSHQWYAKEEHEDRRRCSGPLKTSIRSKMVCIDNYSYARLPFRLIGHIWIRELFGNLSVRIHDLCINVKQNARDFLLIRKLFFSVNSFECVTAHTNIFEKFSKKFYCTWMSYLERNIYIYFFNRDYLQLLAR